MEDDSQVVLAIWSHAHAPPLQPPADVSFDLRKVTNPPKLIRDNYDGRSKRLREHLLHDATFTDLLQPAMEAILQFVKERQDEAPSRQASQPGQTCFVAEDETVTAPATGSSNRTASDDSDAHDEDHASQVENTDDEEALAQRVSQSTKYDSDQEEPDSSTSAQSGEIESDSRLLRISVSCFCERGRHRSVAFAEELGRMAWPRTWDVMVQHRDVDGSGKKESRKGQSGRRGGKKGELAFGIGPDGDEP